MLASVVHSTAESHKARHNTLMTIQINLPETEEIIARRLGTGVFADAEDVILQALKSSEEPPIADKGRAAAIERLATFGARNNLSRGGTTIRELRDEARP